MSASQVWLEVYGSTRLKVAERRADLVPLRRYALSTNPNKSVDSAAPRIFARIRLTPERAALGLTEIVRLYEAGEIKPEPEPPAAKRRETPQVPYYIILRLRSTATVAECEAAYLTRRAELAGDERALAELDDAIQRAREEAKDPSCAALVAFRPRTSRWSSIWAAVTGTGYTSRWGIIRRLAHWRKYPS